MAFRPLRIEILQHVAFEGPGSIETWIRARGHKHSVTRLYAGELPADPASHPGPTGNTGVTSLPDLLIVMGGPMGVHDEAELPWLVEEKRAIARALERGTAVLGVCLGAQLLADVLGATVSRNREREIGWHTVELSAAARDTWMGRAFPERFMPFHWHGDTFAIPSGAVPLGSSAACDHQGFLYGDRVLALQFHPEVTPASLDALIANCGHELAGAGDKLRFVQDEKALRAGLAGASALNAMMAEACAKLESAAACT